VVVTRNGGEIYSESVTVTCSPDPVPTPSPVPAPATPTPVPGEPGVPGADGAVQVMHAVTCLAGNGRVDTNIVNTGDAVANYRIEFEGLSARSRDIAAGDWWRMPITGRPDRDYQAIVKRDGAIVSDTTVTVGCDSDPVVAMSPEVQVVNACRADNGYVLFQFANPTDATKAWVVEFQGVANRSTSAAAHGGAVRAVTGRPDGTYSVLVRTGSTPVATFDVTVTCDQ